MPILDNNGDGKSCMHISVGSDRMPILRHGLTYTDSWCYTLQGTIVAGTGIDIPLNIWGEIVVGSGSPDPDPDPDPDPEVSYTDIAIIALFGQSLGTGSDSDEQSVPIHDISNEEVIAASGASYRPVTSMRVMGNDDPTGTSTLLDLTDIASLVTPADETQSTSNNFTETGLHTVAKKVIDDGKYSRVIVFSAAWGAQAWSERTGVSTDKDNLEPGTYHWCNLSTTLRKMYELAESSFPGETISMPYILFNNGEAEITEANGETQAQTNARIKENYQQLVDGITVESKWITGDFNFTPKAVISTKPLGNGGNATVQANSRRVASAMTIGCAEVPRTIAADPEYLAVGYYTDGVHVNASGYDILGQSFGDAILRDLNNEDTEVLYVTAVAQTASKITLTTNGGTLTQDTSTIPAVTDDGFEVWDNSLSTQRTLSSIVYNGSDIEINGSSFASDDYVRYALEVRAAAVDPVGGNCRESKATRPRWLAPMQIEDLSAFSTPSVGTDPSGIKAHSNRSVGVDPRVVPAYAHSLTANQQTIADSPYLRTWYRANESLEDSGNSQVHCFGKTGANWAMPTSGLIYETISDRSYISGFTATEYVDGPNVMSVDSGPIIIVVNVVQPHSSSARRILGVRYRGSSNLEWAYDIITRKSRWHSDVGVNSFSSTTSAPQSSDDGAGHLHWITIDPRQTNDANIVKARVDDGSWTSIGPMSNASRLNVNHTLRLGNGAGDLSATDSKVSDILIFGGVLGDDSDFDTIETAILTEFGF